MKVDTFFQNFELLTDAPNAVAKLREIILQLSVKGKLVHQYLNDEPASVMLKNIEIEKENLIKHKKIKKIDSLPAIDFNNLPYAIPKNWEWVRLGSLVEVITKGSSPKWQGINYVEDNSGTLFITSENVQNYIIDVTEPKFVEAKFNEIEPRSILKRNDILMNIVGASIGRTAIFDRDDVANINQAVCLIRFISPEKFIELRYILHFFNSPVCISFMFDKQVDSARANLSMGNIAKFPIPLPPLAEQKRIVEKCDRLLSICDEIEKRQQQRQESIVRMNESAIAQLLSSQNPDDFRQHWQRICNNFDLLYSIPETIPKLRQAILQLAVQGRLTNQASREFRKISDTHKVSDYLTILNGYAFKSTWFINDGIRLLRNANVGHGDLRWDDVATISEERAQEFQRFKLDVDDIVISLDRPIISTGLKVARITKNDLPCLLLQRVGKFEFKTDEVIPEFFFLWLQSPIFINAIDPGRSNGVPHISSKSIEAIPFNPPSREEQKRIVEKCDRLMSLCDTLEAKLKQGRDSSEKLMEVAAKQVLTA